jgi:uncharacterized C2H2 Zn-finger protein
MGGDFMSMEILSCPSCGCDDNEYFWDKTLFQCNGCGEKFRDRELNKKLVNNELKYDSVSKSDNKHLIKIEYDMSIKQTGKRNFAISQSGDGNTLVYGRRGIHRREKK